MDQSVGTSGCYSGDIVVNLTYFDLLLDTSTVAAAVAWLHCTAFAFAAEHTSFVVVTQGSFASAVVVLASLAVVVVVVDSILEVFELIVDS